MYRAPINELSKTDHAAVRPAELSPTGGPPVDERAGRTPGGSERPTYRGSTTKGTNVVRQDQPGHRGPPQKP